MVEKIILVNLNLNGNMLKNVAVECLATAPENPVAGQFYVNSADGKFYYYNGTTWVAGAEYTASSKSATGAIPVLDGTVGNDFQFRAVKGSGNLQIAESAGIITFSIDEANLSVSTAVASAIATAKGEAIAAAADDATSKANAAQSAAESTAAADATSKANAAQAAAEATAAADATSKANAAQAAAEAYTDSEIAKLDVTDAEVDGQFVVAVSEADGKVSVSRKAVAGAKVTLPGTAAYGNNTDVDSAVADLYVKSTQGSAVTMTETTGTGDAGKTYTLYQGGQDASHKIGEINVPKDLVLRSGEIRTVSGVPHLILILNDSASTEIDINLNDVFNDYEAGDSLDLSGRKFNLVIDNNSEAFLTIDSTTKKLKLSGVQSAINSAASAAQAAAEATASADATSKANAAQAAAEATAAADATSKANAAEQNAKDYADTKDAAQKAIIDAYTINGKAISNNPTISAKVAQGVITGAVSGVTINTKFPGSIKAFYNGAEALVAIAFASNVATVTWNGNTTLDIYYLQEDVTLS